VVIVVVIRVLLRTITQLQEHSPRPKQVVVEEEEGGETQRNDQSLFLHSKQQRKDLLSLPYHVSPNASYGMMTRKQHRAKKYVLM